MSGEMRECKRCEGETGHRFVRSDNYWQCVICSSKNSKKHRSKYWLRYLAQKANARKRAGSTKMTEEILKSKYKEQDGRCAITRVPFNMELLPSRPSLDRIDSSLGYTSDNIQLVLVDINKIKREFPMPVFYSLCLLVANGYRPDIT